MQTPCLSRTSALCLLQISKRELLLCRVENAGLEGLRGLRRLRALSLAYTNITDPAVASLADLKGLTYLSVDSRLISDDGLKHLLALSNLVALDIFGCKVTCFHPTGENHVWLSGPPVLKGSELTKSLLCRCPGLVQHMLRS